jgi:hypothetical protein
MAGNALAPNVMAVQKASQGRSHVTVVVTEKTSAIVVLVVDETGVTVVAAVAN